MAEVCDFCYPMLQGKPDGVPSRTGFLVDSRSTQSPLCQCLLGFPTVACGNTQYLRSLPLKRLQHFIKAYNLNPAAVSAIEKEDFVQLILKAKDPRSGCMPAAAEVSL